MFFKLRKSVSYETSENILFFETKMGKIIAYAKIISKNQKQKRFSSRELAEATNKQRIFSKILDVPIRKTSLGTTSLAYPSLRKHELTFLYKKLESMQF